MYVWEDQWYRILWHNFYDEEKNIDNLYLGSSHLYCDINPALLDELNGKNNFNLASPTQKLIDSYYLLKEADKKNELSHVYLELYYGVSTGNLGDYSVPEELHWSWSNSDYMKPSINKYLFMITMSKPQNYIEVFLPFTRYREHMLDAGWIAMVMREKDNYKGYKYKKESEEGTLEYLDKGYQSSTIELQEESLYVSENCGLGENPLSADAEKYLRKIIEYCQKNQIELTFFITPMYELPILALGDYDNYIRQIRTIAAEYNIDYYDFNLCKERYLQIQSLGNFSDMGHMNSTGANLLTTFFNRIMMNPSNNNQKYFYASYEEKLKEESPQIYGLVYSNKEDEGTCYIEVASNRDAGIEYRIIVTPEEGEQRVIQDFSDNKMFTVPYDEHGICTVVARLTDEPGQLIRTMEIKY